MQQGNIMKVHYKLSLLTVLMSFMVFLSCDDPKDDDEEQGAESSSYLPYGKLVIQPKEDTGLRLLANDLSSCSMQGDGDVGQLTGQCLTPINVTGFVQEVNFDHNQDDTLLRGSTRVFSEDERTTGDGEIFTGGEIDFSDPTKNLVGNNTFSDIYEEPRLIFTHLGIGMFYMKVKFELKDQFITMLVTSFRQPVSSEDNFSSCDSTISAEERAQSQYEVELLSDMTFEPGDFLFCVKSSTDDVCAASDFLWLDNDTDSLTATRPSNPRQSSSLKKEPSCDSGEGGGIYLTMPTISVLAKFTEDGYFSLYGDATHGPESNRYPGAAQAFGAEGNDPDPDEVEPWTQFFYTP